MIRDQGADWFYILMGLLSPWWPNLSLSQVI